MPASRSLAMWCETVGWLTSNVAVKSQMQTGSLASRRQSAIARRVGSARAFRISVVCSIFSGRALSVGGQHTPRSRSGSTVSLSINSSLPNPLTNVNGLANVKSTLVYASEVRAVSEIQDAVRDRYAAKALQMARPGVTGALALACSLSDADLITRRAEWRAIDAAALIDRHEASGTVTSTYRTSPGTLTELARLVAAEQVCCATSRWELHREGDEVRVTVDASSGSCCEDDCCGTSYS